jgi:hypothetical protein
MKVHADAPLGLKGRETASDVRHPAARRLPPAWSFAVWWTLRSDCGEHTGPAYRSTIHALRAAPGQSCSSLGSWGFWSTRRVARVPSPIQGIPWLAVNSNQWRTK